jgi:hypothetical protein
MSKAKQTSNVSKLNAAAANSKSNAQKTAQPGIIASIMQQLTAAKTSKKAVTVNDILNTLHKQFPTRYVQGMHVTVRAQLSRLPNERDFAITKVRKGRTVYYSAS